MTMGVFTKIFSTGVLLASVLAISVSCGPRDRYVTISGFAQGSTYSVKLNMNGSKGMIGIKPEVIKDSIDSILGKIDRSISGYNRNSLLSRFNAGETIIADSIFVEMSGHGLRFYQETGGAVDVAAAPLFDMWGFGFRNGEFPSEDIVHKTRKQCGMGRLRPDMLTNMEPGDSLNGITLLLCEKGKVTGVPALPQLNYNAIAQGYSCDLVAGYLYSIGAKDFMVDIGEIFCDGLNPSGQPWSIGIDRPVDGNNAPGADIQGIFRVPEGPHGIVTSGNYRKFYVRDGKKYAHTINPLTGMPVIHSLLSATIVAPDAMTADAYATYCMVIGLEESQRFIESRDDLEGCLIFDDNGTFRVWCSAGFVLESL